MSKKLAIISSHPIQYNAPLFALMAKERAVDLRVFYTWGEKSIKKKYDPDFQRAIKWDIPLLEGYNFQFLENVSTEPGSHHFKGIDNPNLIQEIETWGADIVWIWGWSFKSHLQVLRYFKGKKEVWFRGDSTLLDEPKGVSIKKAARRLFLSWVYSHVDKAFYVGTHNKAYFLKHGMKENQLVYAPHAVDNERFADIDGSYKAQANKWKAELGIEEHQFVFLFAGKLVPKKNPQFMIDLMAKLTSNDYACIIVGNGPLECDLKSIATINCYFLPFQNQSMMPIVYRLGDVFVLPSLGPGETWGLAMNESLASGIPIIASNRCGGSIDLIHHEVGVIIDPLIPFDITELTVKIESIKESSEFESRRTEILQNHSFKQILNRVVEHS